MDKFTRWITAHRKFLVAVTGAALTAAIQVWGTRNPWVSMAVLAATSFGVYQAPNTKPGLVDLTGLPKPNFAPNKPTGATPPDTPPPAHP